MIDLILTRAVGATKSIPEARHCAARIASAEAGDGQR